MKLLRVASVRRYALAALATFLASFVRLALKPVLGPERMPYITLFPAVAFCAVYCGVGPSIAALLLAEFAAFYFFTAPVFTFRLQHPLLQIGGMVLFALTSTFIVWMGESKRRALASTERRIQEATAELSLLATSLLRLQDDERRHIARELHDSAGQLLAAISMNVDRLHSMDLRPDAAVMVTDISSLIKETLCQIRTMSHLLHPPLLEEVGLISALQWCVQGFSDRSKIAVALEIDGNLGRYDQNVEIAVFRVIQECLTNIHRHSGATKAFVKVSGKAEGLQIVVEDDGKGIPPEKLHAEDVHFGIGLSGMKQRVTQLRGQLEISSSGAGTIVTASLPVQPVSAAIGEALTA